MSVIAIGGVGGSGTRLIARVLQKAGVFIGGSLNPALDNVWFTFFFRRPDWITNFPEAHEVRTAIELFTRCMQRYPGQKLSADDTAYIADLLDIWSNNYNEIFVHNWRSRVDCLLSNNTTRSQSQRWAWKEPNTHVFLNEIIDYIPEFKYIHIIRNGFDMACSKNQRQLQAWGRHYGVLPQEYNSAHSTALEFWIRANTKTLKTATKKMGDNFILIRYEDFVSSPDHTIQELVRFADLSLSPSDITELVAEISPSTVGRNSQLESTTFEDHQIKSTIALGCAPSFSLTSSDID